MTKDIWFEWLTKRRFGGDEQAARSGMQELFRWRDRILENACLAPGETLLDVGCGDGLVAFGALEAEPAAQVIFSDISQDLLDHDQALVEEMGQSDRCRFLRAPADDLSGLSDGSVDVVTTRSVLIYVTAKQAAFDGFFRVLKPGGRVSIFEPINRFYASGWGPRFMGYDVTPVQEIANKVMALFSGLQPAESDPMLDFDERDLIRFAEKAGFAEIQLDLTATVGPTPVYPFETVLNMALNPKIPTLGEAMQQALTPTEQQAFSDHLRPLVEGGRGTLRMALAFLSAKKGSQGSEAA